MTGTGNFSLTAPGKLTYIMPEPLGLFGNLNYTVTILASDYTSHSVAYMCVESLGGFFNVEFVQILTRLASPLRATVTAAWAALTANNISTSDLVNISTKC
jgi:hypothetical protein